MRVKLLFVLIPILIHIQDTQAQDYVASGYYQLIYEADLAYLEDSEGLAYEKYKEAETCCPLLNQSLYREMQIYAALLIKRKEFDKALCYMEKLAAEYGEIPLEAFAYLSADELLMNDLLISYPHFIDSIAPRLFELSDTFHDAEYDSLIEEIADMHEKNLKIRSIFQEEIKKEFPDREGVLEKVNEVDNENAKRLLEIIKEYGLPTRKKWKIDKIDFDVSISLMFVHSADNEELRELAWKYVQSGEFSPSYYGFVMDKWQEFKAKSNEQKIWLYGIYSNVSDDRIIDIEHIDERRKSIGMPTREMEKKRKELMQKSMNSYNEE